jgi:hypothetical protein
MFSETLEIRFTHYLLISIIIGFEIIYLSIYYICWIFGQLKFYNNFV